MIMMRAGLEIWVPAELLVYGSVALPNQPLGSIRQIRAKLCALLVRLATGKARNLLVDAAQVVASGICWVRRTCATNALLIVFIVPISIFPAAKSACFIKTSTTARL